MSRPRPIERLKRARASQFILARVPSRISGDDELTETKDDDPSGETPIELSDADVTNISLGVVELLFLTRFWIHRRAEAVTDLEPESARREVTISLTRPPPEFAAYSSLVDEIHYLPIALLKKRKLTLFHVCNEHGSAVPTFTRGTRERLMAAALVRLARVILVKEQVPPLVVQDLRTIVGEPRDEARDAFARLDECRGRLAKKEELAPDDLLRAVLFTDPRFRALAWELTHNAPVIVALDANRPAQRMLTYSYEGRPQSERLGFRKLHRRVPRAITRALRGLGWRATKLRFNTPALGDSGSYHFEAEAPVALQLVNPELRVVREVGGAKRERVQDSERGSFRRIHLTAGHLPDVLAAYVRVDLRPRSSTIIRPGWLAATFVASVLTAVGLALPNLKASSPPVALLLVGPTLLSLYIGQREETAMTTRMIFRLRLLAVLPALCGFGAAALLVLIRDHKHFGTYWWIPTVVAWGVVLIFSVALITTRWRRPDRQDEDDLARFKPPGLG